MAATTLRVLLLTVLAYFAEIILERVDRNDPYVRIFATIGASLLKAADALMICSSCAQMDGRVAAQMNILMGVATVAFCAIAFWNLCLLICLMEVDSGDCQRGRPCSESREYFDSLSGFTIAGGFGT